MANRALEAAMSVEVPRCSNDRIVKAINSLPNDQRFVVALFQGLRLSMEDISTVMGSYSISQVKRLYAEGLLGIHHLLTVNADNGYDNDTKAGDVQ